MEKNEINSKWTMEIGRWNEQSGKFEDRVIKDWPDKILKMEISGDQDKKILKFIGGPTGFESYYIDDFIKYPIKGEELCICGGTINIWPRCTVSWKDIESFLQSEGFMKESVNKFLMVFEIVNKWRIKPKPIEDRQEIIECPLCKGQLHLGQSSYNGHCRGRCETEGCITFME
jgi:hypothetical protein